MQSAAEGGGATVEFQVGKIARALEAGVKGIAAQLEVLFHGFLPAVGIADELLAEKFAAGKRLAVVFKLEALAVVGEDGEDIGAGTGALTYPKRFKEAGGEGGDASEFQERAENRNPWFDDAAAGGAKGGGGEEHEGHGEGGETR